MCSTMIVDNIHTGTLQKRTLSENNKDLHLIMSMSALTLAYMHSVTSDTKSS